jgi:DegV family protein with EDD domain
MTVKVVTDSSADIPAQVTNNLDITIVPLYVRFGEQVFKDRVDISEDEFYERLVHDPVHPSTIQPSPQDFATAFHKITEAGADGIISIHISSKLSGTFNSAVQAKEQIKSCPIEVIVGMVVISAAKMAQDGAKLPEIAAQVKVELTRIHLLGLLDTLKYLLLGGRIGKAKALLGSLLNVKPILSLKDGEVIPAGQVRSRSKGIERLYEFVNNASIYGMAISYNTTPDEAQELVKRIDAAKLFKREDIIFSRIGPMLGVHMGPGTIIISYKEKTG